MNSKQDRGIQVLISRIIYSVYVIWQFLLHVNLRIIKKTVTAQAVTINIGQTT